MTPFSGILGDVDLGELELAAIASQQAAGDLAQEVVTGSYFFGTVKGQIGVGVALLGGDLNRRTGAYASSFGLTTSPQTLATVGSAFALAYFHNLDSTASVTITDGVGNVQSKLLPGLDTYLVATPAKALPAAFQAFGSQGTPNIEYSVFA